MTSTERQGHLLALFTIFVWGATFVSTSYVLKDFSPLAVLIIRIVLAILALAIAKPRILKLKTLKHELYFIGASLFGVSLYFLLENYALTYTFSGNVSVIVSTAPFFVAIAMRWFGVGEKLTKYFYIGFIIAIFGISMMSFSSDQHFQLNPLGDLLALLSAISWAGYSVFLKKIESFGYDTMMATRRIFVYGLLECLIFLLFIPTSFPLSALLKPLNAFNFLFLGLCASALCFVTWSFAIRRLGAVKTSLYIYLSPVITIVIAWLLLKDPLLPSALLGAAFTLIGLVISQNGAKIRLEEK